MFRFLRDAPNAAPGIACLLLGTPQPRPHRSIKIDVTGRSGKTRADQFLVQERAVGKNVGQQPALAILPLAIELQRDVASHGAAAKEFDGLALDSRDVRRAWPDRKRFDADEPEWTTSIKHERPSIEHADNSVWARGIEREVAHGATFEAIDDPYNEKNQTDRHNPMADSAGDERPQTAGAGSHRIGSHGFDSGRVGRMPFDPANGPWHR